jgi:F420-dependent oxidoreductase-like protein
VRVGIIVPQGWTGEHGGRSGGDAWQRMVEASVRADCLGFDSLWVFDHVHTTPEPTPAPLFEAYVTLAALSGLTDRARLGQLVTCAAYRNPALLAKMVTTLDHASGGRAELGLGAGWKREEFLAYGFPFPSLRERQDRLRDTLEIVTRMFEPGQATYDGEQASVVDAFNEPKPAQAPAPRVLVGGNGRDVTWRLAARYADELNLDAMPPHELSEALKVLASRCEEVERDPGSLAVSVHIWWEHLDAASSQADLLAAYREAGVGRVMTLVRDAANDPEALDRFRETCLEAGATLDPIAA